MHDTENIVVVDKATKKFNTFIAVNNISFSVPKGDIFAFLGPNGAGKTTTIKMLTTLLAPTNGTIKVNNFDVQRQKNRVRASFGIVFQDPSLDDELTAYENMEFHGVLYGIPRELRKRRIQELMSFVELWERKDHLVKTFSGGMKRRLEIARGLLHHPDIFFLDEPTSGLDPQTRNRIWHYIKDLNKEEGISIFFTTHYMEEAEQVAKRIAIMDHGSIIAQGSADTLMKQTQTHTLEDAFLKLTGTTIREEEGSPVERMRLRRRVMGR